MRTPAVSVDDDGGTYFFCATDYEARAVRRGSRWHKSRVIVTGPGADATRRAVEHAPDDIRRALLIGFASALTATPGRVRIFSIDGVVDDAGHLLTPPWIVEQLDRVRIVSPSSTVHSLQEKQVLAHRSGAVLADHESYAFGQESTRRRWKWGVVRAVFDAADQVLPEGIERLVRPDGRTRWLQSLLWSMRAQRQPRTAAVLQNAFTGIEQLKLVAMYISMPDGVKRTR